MTRAVVACIVLLAPALAQASPFAIDVLSAECSTSIEFRRYETPTVTTATTDCGTTQAMVVPGGMGGLTVNLAADTFATSLYSSVYGGGSVWDSTESLTTFAPLEDGTALIGVEFYSSWYTTTLVSLVDLTSQQTVWEQRWAHGTYQGGTDWSALTDRPYLSTVGSVLVPTEFLADHQYQLNLSHAASSSNDATVGSLKVTGLVAVPEPSSLLLLSAGLAGIGVFRRARTRKPS